MRNYLPRAKALGNDSDFHFRLKKTHKSLSPTPLSLSLCGRTPGTVFCRSSSSMPRVRPSLPPMLAQVSGMTLTSLSSETLASVSTNR